MWSTVPICKMQAEVNPKHATFSAAKTFKEILPILNGSFLKTIDDVKIDQ